MLSRADVALASSGSVVVGSLRCSVEVEVDAVSAPVDSPVGMAWFTGRRNGRRELEEGGEEVALWRCMSVNLFGLDEVVSGSIPGLLRFVGSLSSSSPACVL